MAIKISPIQEDIDLVEMAKVAETLNIPDIPRNGSIKAFVSKEGATTEITSTNSRFEDLDELDLSTPFILTSIDATSHILLVNADNSTIGAMVGDPVTISYGHINKITNPDGSKSQD